MAAGPLDRRRPRVFIAVALGVIAVGGSIGAAHRMPGTHRLDLLSVFLLLVAPVVFGGLLRRRVVAVVATVTALGTYLAIGNSWGPVFGTTMAVLMGLELAGPVRSGRIAAWSGLGSLAVVVPAAFAARGHALAPAAVLGALAWACVLLLVAGALRGRFEANAARRAAARAAAARREVDAVTAERLRIARELHDVLAHSLSAITVQAGVGLHLLDRDVEQARSALSQIRSTSRDALDEVRAVLGVVRADPGELSSDAPDLSERGGSRDPSRSDNDARPAVPRAPTWTLEALPQLVDGFVTAAGSRARLDVSLVADDSARVPPHVAGVVYRVVQESLTNVRRHAADAREVAVVVDVPAPGELRVVVSDDGPGPSVPPPERGYGLRGMRERVEGAGGTLRTGTRADGGHGFEVDARVPLPPLATTPDLSERGSPIPASRSDERGGRGDVSEREGSIAPPGSDSSRPGGAA